MERCYFDHNATTPVAPEVLDVYTAALREAWGNASSIHHHGQQARQRLEEARRHVAALLGARPREIVFTSGGTEADNLALFGLLQPGGHLVTTAIEHPAVLNAAAEWQRQGNPVSVVPVGASGVVEPEEIRRALRPETQLVSVMHVNNELGTVQPLAEIAAVTRAAGVLLHSDGVQGPGRLPVQMAALGVDLYTISAHKLYAPKGSGALYVRDGVRLQPRQFGGRHEQGRRAGTENVAGAVALGEACRLAGVRLAEDTVRIGALRDRLEQAVLARVAGVRVNGDQARRVPNTANLRFEGVEGEPLLISLDLRGFAVSSGAACSSGAVEPSHVLLAVGLNKEEARSSLRFSLGRGTTPEQVEGLVAAIAESCAHLRRLAPAMPRLA